MRTDSSVTIFRDAYRPFPFAIPTIALTFDLEPARSKVTSRLRVERTASAPADAPLVLDGIGLELESVTVDGKNWEGHYTLSATHLQIDALPQASDVEIVGYCAPDQNSTLMGLYISGGNFFTQCEAEGFRRITWMADRPDVMSCYEVTLRASADFAHLLSNGNLISTRTLPDGRHEAVWQDPFLKPSYLFALVVGNFTCREKTVQTQSGRQVLLQVYSDPGAEDRTEWALESLHRALTWDEVRFGLELDLDRFMIVAVRDFNMGAMENKGLNVFNAAYVLADPETATDTNYDAVEAVVGHEYFHNWTGNRVTCRDWFQLSLKEGLTVFRDQEFTADMMAKDISPELAASARAVKRIDDVIRLRSSQFAEDAGPMAHPIRPESYQEIGNFYTATVYEKGAEVIRMQHTLLGEAGFRAGIDEYFRRHDGQAVTCEDFVAAMESVYSAQQPGQDLKVFRNWYSQAGTPRVKVTVDHDAQAKQVKVTLTQRCEPVGVERATHAASNGQTPAMAKKPFHIPFALGLLSPDGEPILLSTEGHKQPTALLHLKQASQTWVFDGIDAAPVPSLLRDFSAPVVVEYDWDEASLALLSAHDPNPFARWEAGQELAARQIFKAIDTDAFVLDTSFVKAWRALLEDPSLDFAYRARALALPGVGVLTERMTEMDPVAMAQAHAKVTAALGQALAPLLAAWLDKTVVSGPYAFTPEQAGKRSLRHVVLKFLAAAGHADISVILSEQFNNANNMTDRLSALDILVNYGQPQLAQTALTAFYKRHEEDALSVDKWFSLQARAQTTRVADVEALMQHPAFTLRNPNRARALVFQFVMGNPVGWHQPDGSGYVFWANTVKALDSLNPEVAARLARAMDSWSRYTPRLREQMKRALETVAEKPGLSSNVKEIVSKSLSLAN